MENTIKNNNKKSELIFNLNLGFNILLAVSLALSLFLNSFNLIDIPVILFVVLSVFGLLPVIYSALKALVSKELTIDLLAAIALVFSLIAKEWYSAAFINLMLASARIFDLWTEKRAQKSIEKLLSYRPNFVKVKRGQDFVDVALSEIKINDLVLVETGKRIPVDGFVASGNASINESTLTGESIAKPKKVGDYVYESTLNESGSLIVKVDKIGDDSAFAKFVALVSEASTRRAKIERIADRFAQWYIGITLVGSIVLFLATNNLLLILSILLVVCADDIAVAVPLSLSAAINHAAKYGILIKGADVIEKISKVKIFLTDKTGTLTYGKPEVADVVTLNKFPKKFLLSALGAAESGSNHPVSWAVEKYIKEIKIKPFPAKGIHEVPGQGISCLVKNVRYFFGNETFLRENLIKISSSDKKLIIESEDLGRSTILVGGRGKLLGFVSLQDKLRPNAKEVISETKKMGVKRWVMLTGDNEDVAKSVSEKIGIDSYQFELKPDEKLKYIENLKTDKKNIVAMIGDGVNDAAALALSDVSFAMGVVGSDAAIEAADVALMTDNLSKIPQAMRIGQFTRRVIAQNFFIWGATNIVGLGLVLTGVIGPAGAASFNFITDFFPILNSLRIGLKRAKT